MLVIAAAVVVPLAVNGLQAEGSEIGSQTVEIREPGNAAGGSCRVEFQLRSVKAGRATLTTSYTGTNECRLQAWLDGKEIVSPLDVVSAHTTVISRSGELRVELVSGDQLETRSYTIPE